MLSILLYCIVLYRIFRTKWNSRRLVTFQRKIIMGQLHQAKRRIHWRGSWRNNYSAEKRWWCWIMMVLLLLLWMRWLWYITVCFAQRSQHLDGMAEKSLGGNWPERRSIMMGVSTLNVKNPSLPNLRLTVPQRLASLLPSLLVPNIMIHTNASALVQF